MHERLLDIFRHSKAVLGRHKRAAGAVAGAFLGVSAPYVLNGIQAQSPEKGFEPDAAIVLAGGGGRVARGIEMWLEDGDENLRVFISGAQEDQNLENVIGATYPRIVAHPDIDEIELGDNALNTVGNALEIRNWLKANPEIKNIVVITSDYHVPRTRLELSRVLPNDIEVRYERIDNGFNPRMAIEEIGKTGFRQYGFGNADPALRSDPD